MTRDAIGGLIEYHRPLLTDGDRVPDVDGRDLTR
jgi:hypothetical protein